MKIIAHICAAVLLAVCPLADAGLPDPSFSSSVWSVLPAQPTTRTPVIVRNIASGCNGAEAARTVQIDHATGIIDFYLEGGSDVCGQYYYDDVHDTSLGYLEPGAYTIRFVGCAIPYDPNFPGCSEASWIPRLSFVVADAGRARQTIPATSGAGLAILVGVLLLLAAHARRAS